MSRANHTADTREHLLATGEEIILGKGFAAVGLAEILSSAGVPKGSFYHYFQSKEGYGVELLRRYFLNYDEQLVLRLRPEAGPARDSLLKYFNGWVSQHRCDAQSHTCLAVKLAAEVSDLSEPMREALAEGMGRVISRLADAIRRGQQEGSLCVHLPADELAASLYSLWVGSALLYKVQRSAQPMLNALKLTETMLKVPSAANCGA
ncbi:TetR/AcrR family transcriptional regulator [Chromobacterium subtsugae]|uniref:TetR/AcrR family transcriptional regulator n=1 Tax=Chromobacterium subtsugae TaxID=251747 RepID=A0ABS7FIZ8_9NEIS|nr:MULTISPECIES: TetR/AcrR family transcriptional regulator [Chromobacterium]KUM01932.1 transcriptional repressor NemR [Chromobacterium subtsugae]KZE86506.1 transcriptional repressor NemR [Chromobacterium sp. F49]MBW7568963.1 TetR/AcrR family transcriptional regulator [Chromobacterium subtsugae]MBW8290024.1 TetR/AcrR family transcriptional regulator [Chromobacterium subtsugae]WSE92965.1 TetR/AcrR family transcriptional regulator [Chromobacterium subtsugae]